MLVNSHTNLDNQTPCNTSFNLDLTLVAKNLRGYE